MSERVDRPVISPLRPEIANPQPAGRLESFGIAVLNTPFAIRDKAEAWRRLPVPARFGSAGTVAFACLVGAWLAFGHPTPQLPFQGDPTELVDSRYIQLSVKETTTNQGLAVSNITSILKLGVNMEALHSLSNDASLGINKPAQLEFFTYITDHNAELESQYNETYARNNMNIGKSSTERGGRLAVKKLTFDLERYKEMYKDFVGKYGLPPGQNDDVAVSVGMTYDWVMALKEEILGSRAVPALTPEQFNRMLEAKPFKASLQKPTIPPSRGYPNASAGYTGPAPTGTPYVIEGRPGSLDTRKQITRASAASFSIDGTDANYEYNIPESHSYIKIGHTGLTAAPFLQIGIGNLIEGLTIGVDTRALERLNMDPVLGINMPSDSRAFTYITRGIPGSQGIYDRNYALRFLAVPESQLNNPRYRVMNLVPDAVGASFLADFGVDLSQESKIDLLNIRLAADWISNMRRHSLILRSPDGNARPQAINNDDVRRAAEERPFIIYSVNWNLIPSRTG